MLAPGELAGEPREPLAPLLEDRRGPPSPVAHQAPHHLRAVEILRQPIGVGEEVALRGRPLDAELVEQAAVLGRGDEVVRVDHAPALEPLRDREPVEALGEGHPDLGRAEAERDALQHVAGRHVVGEQDLAVPEALVGPEQPGVDREDPRALDRADLGQRLGEPVERLPRRHLHAHLAAAARRPPLRVDDHKPAEAHERRADDQRERRDQPSGEPSASAPRALPSAPHASSLPRWLSR